MSVKLRPIEISDLELLRKWRQDKGYMLRTDTDITSYSQEIWFEKIVSNRDSKYKFYAIDYNTTLLGYGHGEEMFYLDILDEFYDEIERSYGDYGNILNNFFGPTVNIHYINHLIVGNYIKHEYFKEGYECCFKLVREIENYNSQVNYELYLSILYNYYICTYHYRNSEEANKILNHIELVVSKHPQIKSAYDKLIQFNNNFIINNKY
jgi:hypothetical protein